MSYGEQEYKATVTLTKFLWTFLGLSAAGNAIAFPTTLEEFKTNWPIFVVSFLGAAHRAYKNWKSNGGPERLNKWLGR